MAFWESSELRPMRCKGSNGSHLSPSKDLSSIAICLDILIFFFSQNWNFKEEVGTEENTKNYIFFKMSLNDILVVTDFSDNFTYLMCQFIGYFSENTGTDVRPLQILLWDKSVSSTLVKNRRVTWQASRRTFNGEQMIYSENLLVAWTYALHDMFSSKHILHTLWLNHSKSLKRDYNISEN